MLLLGGSENGSQLGQHIIAVDHSRRVVGCVDLKERTKETSQLIIEVRGIRLLVQKACASTNSWKLCASM